MRPFLALLAQEHGVTGEVCNVGSSVLLTATGTPDTLERFARDIPARAPAQSQITALHTADLPHRAFEGFAIVASAAGAVARLPADFPVCEDCAQELRDPANRRHRHPFISCAVCGPRYSILESAPYDRHTTSMVDFPMCPSCRREYENPRDRRFHAQTISCPECGPVLLWQPPTGRALEREDALAAAISALRAGSIVAIKGVGGYHLACDPRQEDAVGHLRALKGRELKPFAILFASMERLKACCEATEADRALLMSPARPIVLLPTKGEPFAPSVNGGTALTGAFLPYTPVQMLLLGELGELVMTSANRSGQPEIHDDDEMLGWLGDGRLDGVLWHRRRIVTRLDDSVARVVGGAVQTTRRARGYAPLPLPLPAGDGRTVLAMGGDLKAAFCLMQGGRAYMSQYFGDVEEAAVAAAYRQNLDHMERLFALHPDLVVCDRHPGYHTALLARGLGLPLTTVQHHHAHVASVMAEHGLTGQVLGVAFDGTGYGDDGAVWGGEFLLCEGAAMERVAHLAPVTLTGGDRVAKDGRLAALCYAVAAGLEAPAFDGADLAQAALAAGVNAVPYTGLGRLFDAISARLGVCEQNGYEGQCAILLEQASARAEAAGVAPLAMDFAIVDECDTIQLDWKPALAALWHTPPERRDAAALGFHRALARAVVAVCRRARAERGVGQIALSGGVFQNALLLTAVTEALASDGFAVYTNHAVPVNDGGLALGQAWLALQGRQ